ncbi:hypothetical protein RIF29_15018 [Crotalaria pallida]|uniref:Uncharacterized protein n=1 Tax=Crotalaria pallida TaxID=3830 RepID=A0AAN9FEA5_CROPI
MQAVWSPDAKLIAILPAPPVQPSSPDSISPGATLTAAPVINDGVSTFAPSSKIKMAEIFPESLFAYCSQKHCLILADQWRSVHCLIP